MIRQTFKEDNLSLLGFGTMRLPVLSDGSIDETQVEAIPKWADICREREELAKKRRGK